MASVHLSVKNVDPVQPFDSALPGIILLHGMTSSQLTWLSVMERIANGTGRRVFTYDARNHGDSEWTNDFDYDTMVTDLGNVMKSLNMKKATLLGHSMGGKVAMKFAVKSPEMVEKLIIEDITPKPRPVGDRRYIHVYIEILRESLGAIPPNTKTLDRAKDIIAHFIYDKIPSAHQSKKHVPLSPLELPLKIDEDGNFQWKANLTVIEDSLLNVLPLSARGIDGIFDGPTLFLYGTKSAYGVIKEADYILERFPNAIFNPIEGGGHLLHAEYTDEFTEKVLNFFNDS